MKSLIATALVALGLITTAVSAQAASGYPARLGGARLREHVLSAPLRLGALSRASAHRPGPATRAL